MREEDVKHVPLTTDSVFSYVNSENEKKENDLNIQTYMIEEMSSSLFFSVFLRLFRM